MRTAAFIIIVFSLSCRLEGQDLNYASEIVKTLASDDFKGRGYVGKGQKLAADYIINEFEKSDLIPLSKNYLQKFHVSVNTFPGSMYVRLGSQLLQPGKDFIMVASSPAIKGKYKVHKFTREDIRTEEDLMEVIKITGSSFMLIDSRDKKNEPPDVARRTDFLIEMLEYTLDIPTRGVIIYTDAKLTMSIANYKALRPFITVNSELNIDEVKDIEVNVDASFKNKYVTGNIAGYLKGTSGTDSMIVLTAHYDHIGTLGENVIFPGANDNASGVAMLLNLAKHYSQNPPLYDMVFMAMAAEELGMEGAIAFCEKPLFELSKVKFLVNFDLAGTGDEGIRVVNGTVYNDKFSLLEQLNNKYNLLPKVDVRGEACISDHCIFYRRGVPSFYIYTQGGIDAYHDINDRWETLPLTEFVDYSRLMILFLDAI